MLWVPDPALCFGPAPLGSQKHVWNETPPGRSLGHRRVGVTSAAGTAPVGACLGAAAPAEHGFSSRLTASSCPLSTSLLAFSLPLGEET